MMSFTIELPEELASQLTALLPEVERRRFAVSAIAEALKARQRAGHARLAAVLLAELNPASEPEREAAECIAAVEEGLEDVDAGRALLSFEKVRRQWEAERTARRAFGNV